MYREYAPPDDLRALLACTWVHRATSAQPQLVVPDGCMDFVFDGSALRLAGPDTRPVREAGAGALYLGVRFRIGRGASLLGVPASALCDTRAPLAELWGDRARRLEDALRACDPERGLELMAMAVRAAPARSAPDAAVHALIAQLAGPDRRWRIAPLAAELGLSERQLHRRCCAAVGYGPKLLARILRLQQFRRALARAPDTPLATLAAALGYVDQAHLSHDASALFGRTPAALRAAAMSDFDKTRTPAGSHAGAHEDPRQSTPRRG